MHKTKLNIILAGTLIILFSAISSRAVTVTTTSLPNATVGEAYEAALTATGGMAPYTWKASSTLPAGLAIGAGGVLKGTPTTAGSYSISFVVKDVLGATAKESLAFSVVKGLSVTRTGPTYSNINPGSSPAPAPATLLKITTASLTNGTVGTAYSESLLATGGTTPYSWSVAGGALPPGMALGSAGLVKGTPTSSGSYSFTAQVLDSSKTSASYTYILTIVAP